MNPVQPGALSNTVTKQMAWSAFDFIFTETDWRLQIASLQPLSFCIEHDDTFASCLSGSDSWKGRDHALFWISSRVLSLASSFDKTFTRRLSLQLPDTVDGATADALLTNLERRIRDAVLDELVQHFDTSIPEWEREVQVGIAGLDDPDQRWHASRYVGLDQLVSVDACRKAIRFVFCRTHWFLTEQGGLTVLNPDWRFEQFRAQRSTLHEQTRARSLVARCIEVLVAEHVREQRTGVEVAPMTRLRLKAEVDRMFAEKGVWGLVDHVLPRDRSNHYLRAPEGLPERLQGLLDAQDQRLEVWLGKGR